MAKQKRFATHITAVNGKRVYLSAGSKEELEKKIFANCNNKLDTPW